ncbi:YfhO family protein [Adlercreutzia caecimuris]|uniref:YfhO family protein n=1 Tax=Adlercreutzia caecimuris TaxID=671266 RepID=UPI001C3C4F1C|nr:YfhO family protein [Adlercreutzia caecimuris]
MKGLIRTRGRYFALLFAACLATFALMCAVFIENGRSLLWQNDSLSLYYPLFVYEGQWLRDVFGSIGQPDFAVPLYSLDIGYGADILATAGGCFNDPLNLISAFCPPEYAEYLFEALIFVRFFLAAAAFSLYCFGHGRGQGPTLCGSLAYVLCGYVVMWGVMRHPNFINLAILLPLILRGADKVFERKSPALLMVSMGLLFFFSVYFSYMTLIALFIYCLIKYFLVPRKRSLRDFAALLGRFVLYLGTAALLAGLFLVPIVLVLTSMGRVGLTREIPLLETFNFYWQLGSNLVGGSLNKRGMFLGVVPVLGVIAFLIGRRQLGRSWAPWALGFGLCFVGALLPPVGSAMNGFGYATDRWLLVLGFCAAYMLVLVVPQLRRFGRRQWAVFTLVGALLAVWTGAYAFDVLSKQAAMACVLLVAIAIVFVLVPRRVSVAAMSAAVAVCLAGSSAGLVVIGSSKWGTSFASSFVPSGEAVELTRAFAVADEAALLDKDYRIDRAGAYGARNQTMVSGFKGFDFFSSYYNQKLDDSRYDLGVASHWTNYIYNGVDRRLALELLGGARYFVANDDDRDKVPYGYAPVADLGEMPIWDDDEEGGAKELRMSPVRLYESDAALPLAFTYDEAVPESTYRSLPLVERQELLTRACVLADERVARNEDEALRMATVEQEADIVKEKGLVVRNGAIEVAKRGARLRIAVDGVPDAENYVVFENLVFNPLDPAGQRALAEETGVKIEPKKTDRGPGWWIDLKWAPDRSAGLQIKAADRERSLKIANSRNAGYGGKVDWAVNMGYSEEPATSFTIKFSKPGVYSFDRMYVASQPVAAIEENVKKLQDENAASVSFGTNRISVDVAAEKDDGDDARYVFLSVPYSPGWSATVDGRPAEILQANVGFMALAVDGAAHDIQLTYITPGLVAGAWCSVAGIALFAGILLVRKKMRKRA